MAYRIAGIDVHERMLAVVIADVTVEGEYEFERRRVGTRPSELRALAEWLAAQEVEEVVMESTARIGGPHRSRFANSARCTTFLTIGMVLPRPSCESDA